MNELDLEPPLYCFTVLWPEDELFNVSEPQYPNVQDRSNSIYLLSCLRQLKEGSEPRGFSLRLEGCESGGQV